MSLDEVFNAAYDAYNAGYFAQLSAEDVDAIADQIGALSVDEVASAVEDLFALAQTEGWVDSLGTVWDKTKEAASEAYDSVKEAASDAYDWTAE